MSELTEIYIDTGKRDYSGTGKNRHTTTYVDLIKNYALLPLAFTELVSARGKEIRPARDLKALAAYWAEFGHLSSYEVYFSMTAVPSMLVTKTGAKTVGAISKYGAAAKPGTFVLLPMLRYDKDKFTEKKGEKQFWTKAALSFGNQLVSDMLQIDLALTSERETTPEPAWANSEDYRIATERGLEAAVSAKSEEIEKLQVERSQLAIRLERERSLRRLLYANGSELEDAILEGLSLFGLKAERYKDTESDFDSVFVWNGKRFLGEAEGKDTKPINIDKMSQLERNLSEDFARDDVQEHAQGILFGNAYRLQAPAERADYFTDKCLSAAKRAQIALIRTSDLFFAAKHMKESGDADFARRCVEAIVAARGTIVAFPSAPSHRAPTESKTVGDDPKTTT